MINLFRNYDGSLAHEYGGFVGPESVSRSSDQYPEQHEKYEDEEEEDEGVRRYSAFDAWNGSVEADTDHEFSVVKLGDDCVMREFWIKSWSIWCITWSTWYTYCSNTFSMSNSSYSYSCWFIY